MSNVLYACSDVLFITNISSNLATVANQMDLRDSKSLIRLRYEENVTCCASSDYAEPLKEIVFRWSISLYDFAGIWNDYFL